ncbi:hypothetical protein Dpep_0478 [Dethiosulfovibrio peptidovorans DSM 11002]|uniref:Uncharacterized protein n=1 Tax=Dethiosulfovibrio peptidovorans DSM 11002 TaxID=469381 RepID=D2Z4H9_9BACT|nr:hypothetical protein [Dethiosulfovibrio peptidovorans]EFC90508.1 hypothetical protein Dpep_0478 [Dethiosulfovibrio peptidovorans DSM 11002]
MESYLYRPGSVMSPREGDLPVSIVWIPLRAERIRVAPYPMLIKNYENLSGSETSIAKGFVDEFFSLTELNQFRVYMENERKIVLTVERISVPVECRDGDGLPFVPFRCREGEEGWHSLCLDGRDRMDLPFDIVGYYRL